MFEYEFKNSNKTDEFVKVSVVFVDWVVWSVVVLGVESSNNISNELKPVKIDLFDNSSLSSLSNSI